jgi:DNA-binding response OmpR family regulator
MRVLLIDDEIGLAANIARALSRGAGFAVDCAHHARERAVLTELEPYDLLLLDLMPPVLIAYIPWGVPVLAAIERPFSC